MWPWNKTEKKQYDTRSLIIDNEFLVAALMQDTVTPTKAMQYYRKNSSIATAVDMIADAIASIQPVIELADGTISTKHPVLDFLDSPNPGKTWLDIAGEMSRHYLLTGQCCFYGLGAQRRPPSEINTIKPQNVSVSADQNQGVNQFIVGAGPGQGSYTRDLGFDRVYRYYDGPLKEFYRVQGFSSRTDDATPDSPLQAVLLEIEQQIKGRIHNLKILENGGRLSLLIVFKEEMLTDDEHRDRTQRINETMAGPQNAGRIGVMSGGDVQEVREMGNNNKDMDYVMLDTIASKAIYFRYKIPLALVTTDASSYNNLSTAYEMLYDMAVLPLADRLFTGLSRFILPRFGLSLSDIKITYNPDSLTALRQRRLNELKLRKDIGVETVNELREGLPNREDIANGDVIYQNATLVPMGTDVTANQGAGYESDPEENIPRR